MKSRIKEQRVNQEDIRQGGVVTRLSDEDIAEAEATVVKMRAWAQETYSSEHPEDHRSLDERINDVWNDHFNGTLDVWLAPCPYCGTVPALNDRRGLCCKLGRWFRDGVANAEQGEWLERIDRAAANFGQAMAEGDPAIANAATAELIEVTSTHNLEDAFTVARLWPSAPCGGRYCFKTPTRVWHAPNWCAEVDGSARDYKVWEEGGKVGPPPLPRIVESEPRLLDERRMSEEEIGASMVRHQAETERQLIELYGESAVARARAAQREFEIQEDERRSQMPDPLADLFAIDEAEK
jgi:hypothetical protein